jgi:hypothetical protein
MRDVPLHDHAGLSPTERVRLEETVRGQRTLADVLAWGRAQRPPITVAEILTQDEYTHDVVVRLSEHLVLVYDTT